MSHSGTQDNANQAPRSSRFLQLFIALFMALSMSGIAHAAEELAQDAEHLEHVVHEAVVANAHSSCEHAEDELTHGVEHFCFGAVHNCACCPSAVANTTPAITVRGALLLSLALQPRTHGVSLEGIHSRVERPPCA